MLNEGRGRDVSRQPVHDSRLSSFTRKVRGFLEGDKKRKNLKFEQHNQSLFKSPSRPSLTPFLLKEARPKGYRYAYEGCWCTLCISNHVRRRGRATKGMNVEVKLNPLPLCEAVIRRCIRDRHLRIYP